MKSLKGDCNRTSNKSHEPSSKRAGVPSVINPLDATTNTDLDRKEEAVASGKPVTRESTAGDAETCPTGERVSLDLTCSNLPAINGNTVNCTADEKSWGTEPYGYQWPASRLSRRDMARLTIVSNIVKRPLNQLIKEAVAAYASEMLKQLGYCPPNDKASSCNS